MKAKRRLQRRLGVLANLVRKPGPHLEPNLHLVVIGDAHSRHASDVDAEHRHAAALGDTVAIDEQKPVLRGRLERALALGHQHEASEIFTVQESIDDTTILTSQK